jgi:hypothetical protein
MHGCRKKRKVDKQRIVIAEFLNAREGEGGGVAEPALRKKASNAANPAFSPDVPEPTWSSLPTMLIKWLGCQSKHSLIPKFEKRLAQIERRWSR